MEGVPVGRDRSSVATVRPSSTESGNLESNNGREPALSPDATEILGGEILITMWKIVNCAKNVELPRLSIYGEHDNTNLQFRDGAQFHPAKLTVVDAAVAKIPLIDDVNNQRPDDSNSLFVMPSSEKYFNNGQNKFGTVLMSFILIEESLQKK